MKNYFLAIVFIVSFFNHSFSQEIGYLPEKNAVWQEKTPNALNINSELLDEAVKFAIDN